MLSRRNKPHHLVHNNSAAPAHSQVQRINYRAFFSIVVAGLVSLLTPTLALAELQPIFTSKPPLIEGKVRTIGIANNEFAPYLAPEYHDWLDQSFDIMQVYSPWFDDITSSYSNGFAYKDMYAIYNCRLPHDPNDKSIETKDGMVAPDSVDSICAGANQPILLGLYEAAMQAENDPDVADWILKNNDGNFLFIHFTDDYDRYTQFAADIRNPAFRQFWLQQMHYMLSPKNDQPASKTLTSKYGAPLNYRGIFVDDVNMDLDKAISNGVCRLIDVPLKFADGTTCDWSTAITDVEWADSVVNFVQEIRAEFPDLDIIHNSVWYHTGPDESYIDAQIAAADIISVERGFHDANFNANLIHFLLAFNDKVHQLGRSVSHYIRVYNEKYIDIQDQQKELEHGLAGWLLISNGSDYFGGDRFMHPDTWWEGFNINLGEATTNYYLTNEGLYRRDFSNGITLLNPQPLSKKGSTSIHIDLPGYFLTLDGQCINDITLPAASGKVLFTVASCTPITTYSTDFTSGVTP